MNTRNKKLIGLIVITLLAIGGTGAAVMLGNANPTPSPRQVTTNSAQQSTNSAAATSYTDGTYEASGAYRSPGGTQSIDVRVTLKDDAISEVTVSADGSGESGEYQRMFKSGISSQVIGKDIDEVNVSRVSGSSLTSSGFNRALEAIRQDARA